MLRRGENDEIFSQDMIGHSIVGCIDHVDCQILLLDDGRTIEIANASPIGDSEGYLVNIGNWKATDVQRNGAVALKHE